MVSDPLDLGEIMAGDQDQSLLPLELLYQMSELDPPDRIESLGRLVENDEFSLCEDSLCEAHSLEETTGEGPYGIGAMGSESEALDRLIDRSEEHTSELQSRGQLVCRLLLE